MTSGKPEPAVAVRRKPALTYQSPAQSTGAKSSCEESLSTSQSATTVTPTSPPMLSQPPELSQGATAAHKPGRQHATAPLLPLYHPFGTLALSLPDLDPTAFGLPAPVAVFGDPTRRLSNRHRRPAAKVRDGDGAATANSHMLVAATPAPEPDAREKASPRRRRGGGPGGKRKRREPEDGDATYPAKRARNPRSSGVASGLSGARALSREVGSPALSNAHTGASPALDSGRGDVGDEKKPGRRTTRSRGAIVRRDSTASEDTASSASPSGSASNTVVPRTASSGEPAEADELRANESLKKSTGAGDERKNADTDEMPVLDHQGS